MPAYCSLEDLVIGGYILDLDQAKEWADKRFPDQNFQWRSRGTVDVPINRCLNDLFNNEGDQRKHDRCIVVPWKDSVRVCFPTVSIWNPPKGQHISFQENDTARSLKKVLFEKVSNLTYLEEIPFVTIYDPYYTKRA
ncbi:hypothetical protein PAXINDRAFT_103361 [Paxillus involutus ATCC 200175]|uniref:Unplaced genomic scaffold PAXINscaffold_995, whole genome shotgun sequence n=1 Tax=Paxillus involutus ATCC 200175 TaxID=664439 RepID=A0A0C9T513_PAXIN|nr:hypothetical protein PAXINDRAFT_103361 [Paxillus involutus ATCC 200175]